MNRRRIHIVVLALVSLALPALGHAAGLSVTPPSIAADYTGLITLTITGLASGQTVLVEAYLDLDANGTIESGDRLVQSFQVTDGQAASIDGVRNTNVPGDEDATAGTIRTVLNYQALAEADKVVATFVYRVSPVTSGFPPVSTPFAITQPAYGQRVVGKVTSGDSGVPYALTALTDSMGNGSPRIAALADSSGNFTLNAMPGSYAVLALAAGFLSDLSLFPIVTLSAGETVTQNLSLDAADRSISGRLTDLESGAAIPGVQVFTQSPALATLVFSDADGTVAIPVSAAQWNVAPSERSLALLGYLSLKGGYAADTSGGSVSGASIQLPKGTALIYGTLTNDQGIPVAGVNVFAGNSQYEGYGITDSTGKYVVAVVAGMWSIGPEDGQLRALGYEGSGGMSVAIDAGQAMQQDFIALPVGGTPTPTPPPVGCVGDCDGNGQVTVNELIVMVNIALGTLPVSACTVGDVDGSGSITVNEVIVAVNYALVSCPG